MLKYIDITEEGTHAATFDALIAIPETGVDDTTILSAPHEVKNKYDMPDGVFLSDQMYNDVHDQIDGATPAGVYKASIKIKVEQCGHPLDPPEFDVYWVIEKIECVFGLDELLLFADKEKIQEQIPSFESVWQYVLKNRE